MTLIIFLQIKKIAQLLFDISACLFRPFDLPRTRNRQRNDITRSCYLTCECIQFHLLIHATQLLMNGPSLLVALNYDDSAPQLLCDEIRRNAINLMSDAWWAVAGKRKHCSNILFALSRKDLCKAFNSKAFMYLLETLSCLSCRKSICGFRMSSTEMFWRKQLEGKKRTKSPFGMQGAVPLDLSAFGLKSREANINLCVCWGECSPLAKLESSWSIRQGWSSHFIKLDHFNSRLAKSRLQACSKKQMPLDAMLKTSNLHPDLLSSDLSVLNSVPRSSSGPPYLVPSVSLAQNSWRHNLCLWKQKALPQEPNATCPCLFHQIFWMKNWCCCPFLSEEKYQTKSDKCVTELRAFLQMAVLDTTSWAMFTYVGLVRQSGGWRRKSCVVSVSHWHTCSSLGVFRASEQSVWSFNFAQSFEQPNKKATTLQWRRSDIFHFSE